MESNSVSQVLTSFEQETALRHEIRITAEKLHLTFKTNDGPVSALQNVNSGVNKGDFVSFIKGFCGAI